eukprot:8785592-Pyramimonas_sp.AAC.1
MEATPAREKTLSAARSTFCLSAPGTVRTRTEPTMCPGVLAQKCARWHSRTPSTCRTCTIHVRAIRAAS